MSSSAFPFLDGRSTFDSPLVRVPRRRTRHAGLLDQVRRRLDRRRFAAEQARHDRRDMTDAYLDRTGLSSVDWSDTLSRFAQR